MTFYDICERRTAFVGARSQTQIDFISASILTLINSLNIWIELRRIACLPVMKLPFHVASSPDSLDGAVNRQTNFPSSHD